MCSVLFVDLVGFTPLAEHADPEDVRELLGRYFDRAQGIIDNYGGTLEKFIGDAVMAVWGTPAANEDDAERAVRAGLDVVAAVAELGRTHHEGLAARAGIVTGEVAVSVGREHEGMVIGDPVNAASRIQSAAEPGTVLVDESTWRASSEAIAYEERGALTVKGKSDPVVAWRALRVVGQRGGLGRAEGLEPPFVGRGEELLLVKELLHATKRENRARLVSVTGVPGIGKSRLAWEFVKYVDGLAEDVYWHEGRSAAYGADVTFGALGEIVRMRAGIHEEDGPDLARDKLTVCVQEYVEDEEERRWVEPRLAHLLGLADAPPGDRDELFGAWRKFFEQIARLGVTVLVFEDLQFADPGLIDFIESLVEWSRDHAIMIVTLARPELLDSHPEWGAGQRSFTSLHLDPLSDAEMSELLRGFVRGLPDEVEARIRQRADGVPLYAVEMVRALVDRGILVSQGGTYRVEGTLESLVIPETLHALVASRLDALPTEERVLLQDAAVIGATFRIETLAAVQDAPTEVLEPMLRSLVKREFLRREMDPRSPDRGQYGFVQAVIGEVAVAMLSRKDRSAKHLAVAQYCEGLDDEELTGVVAAQYAWACRVAPEEMRSDEMTERATIWLGRAGDRATSLGSPDQAIALYSEALEMTTSGAARADLLEAIGIAATKAARFEESTARLEEAAAIHESLGDRAGVTRARSFIADNHASSRRYGDAAAVAESAYVDVDEYGTPAVRFRLARVLSSAFGQISDTEKALQWAEVALLAAEELNDTQLLITGLLTRANALSSAGRYREARILARAMSKMAQESGAQREEARAYLTIGVLEIPEDVQETVRASAAAAEIARRLGDRPMEDVSRLNFVENAIFAGDWAEAKRVLDELESRRSLESAEETQSGGIVLLAAVFSALSGDTEFALASYDEERREAIQSSDMLATDLYLHALILLAAGDLEGAKVDAARAVAIEPVGINVPPALSIWSSAALWSRDAESTRDALTAARRMHGRRVEARALAIEAGLLALNGRVKEAVVAYELANESWRENKSILDLVLTEIDAALLLGGENVPEMAAEATEILTSLQAKPFLERLQSS